MKKYILTFIVVFLATIVSKTYSQEAFAKIDKNRNVQANGLFHALNKTKDTLILKSDKKINYLYSINKEHNRDLDFYIDSKSYKLPLNKLSKGKHVFVAVQSPLRIVFVVHILKEIPIIYIEENSKPIAIKSTEVVVITEKNNNE